MRDLPTQPRKYGHQDYLDAYRQLYRPCASCSEGPQPTGDSPTRARALDVLDDAIARLNGLGITDRLFRGRSDRLALNELISEFNLQEPFFLVNSPPEGKLSMGKVSNPRYTEYVLEAYATILLYEQVARGEISSETITTSADRSRVEFIKALLNQAQPTPEVSAQVHTSPQSGR